MLRWSQAMDQWLRHSNTVQVSIPRPLLVYSSERLDQAWPRVEWCPGTTCSVSVTYLTEQLLDRMHATEGAYDFHELTDISLSFRNGEKINAIFSYNHQYGSLHLPMSPDSKNSPIALSEISAVSRNYPALSQVSMNHHFWLLFSSSGAYCIYV